MTEREAREFALAAVIDAGMAAITQDVDTTREVLSRVGALHPKELGQVLIETRNAHGHHDRLREQHSTLSDSRNALALALDGVRRVLEDAGFDTQAEDADLHVLVGEVTAELRRVRMLQNSYRIDRDNIIEEHDALVVRLIDAGVDTDGVTADWKERLDRDGAVLVDVEPGTESSELPLSVATAAAISKHNEVVRELDMMRHDAGTVRVALVNAGFDKEAVKRSPREVIQRLTAGRDKARNENTGMRSALVEAGFVGANSMDFPHSAIRHLAEERDFFKAKGSDCAADERVLKQENRTIRDALKAVGFSDAEITDVPHMQVHALGRQRDDFKRQLHKVALAADKVVDGSHTAQLARLREDLSSLRARSWKLLVDQVHDAPVDSILAAIDASRHKTE